jgi:hypothetical protein
MWVGGLLVVGVLVTSCSGTTQAVKHPPTTRTPPSPPTTTAPVAATSPAVPPTSVATTTTMSASPDTAVEVYGDCQHPSFEPSEIVMACADYGALVQNLHWSSWTSSGATALGTLVYKKCVPDCATGGFGTVPNDEITLSDPIAGGSGQLVWSQIKEDPEPPGYTTGPYGGGAQPLPTGPD